MYYIRAFMLMLAMHRVAFACSPYIYDDGWNVVLYFIFSTSQFLLLLRLT